MLSASMKVEENLDRFSIAHVGAVPCTARNVLAIQVRVAPPWVLLWNWLRIHLRGGRPNTRNLYALVLGLAGVVALGAIFFLCARFYSVDFLAKTEPAPATVSATGDGSLTSEGATSRASKEQRSVPTRRTADGHSWRTVVADATFSEWVRASLLLFGPWAIAFIALSATVMRKTLCEVYVIGLLPHQPFPVIEQFLARSSDKHVVAIRFLSESNKQRFFGTFVDRLKDKETPSRLTTLDVTHANVRNAVDPGVDDERQQYWSLVRYGIGVMLSRHGMVRQSAIGFTYKLHEWFFIAYFVALGMVVALPSLGWLPNTEETQFPLIMVGIGVVWAAILIVVHLGVVEHLGAWERMTATPPFNGCPIYRYSEQVNAGGDWHPLELEDFQAPIRDMGLPSDRMLEITLGIMLIIYLTALQIVK